MNTCRWGLVAVMVMHAATFAHTTQILPAASFEDQVLGWMNVYSPAAVRKPLQVDNKVYSPAQLSIADALATWMQASYVPKGGLGQIRTTVSTKLGLYNQADAALPQTYGAYAKTFTELKYDANRKLIPASDSHLRWRIVANGLDFGEPLQVLNTPTHFYFLMPLFGEPIVGRDDDASIRLRRRYDLSAHPVLKRYTTYFNFQMYSSRYANSSNVLLSKDNKLPFIKITRGEYLDRLAEAVERRHVKEKEDAIKSWPEGNARARALAAADDRHGKRLGVLENTRAKYQARLNETAEVSSLQPSVLLENNPDLFDEQRASQHHYPVYKVDPALAELTKTDSPQWILVSWDGDTNEPVGKQLNDAILNNFDFDYLYNFFFDAAKVQGQPYKPLRSPHASEVTVTTEASAAAKANASNPGVHFFDDFSTTVAGQKPIGWSGATARVVTTLDGLPGNWALMAGDANLLTPDRLTRPLPRDFTLSYDLVAAQNFAWGAKGLTVQLASAKTASSAESYLRLRLRPGFDGRDGEAAIEAMFPAGYMSETKWVAATGFSNNKKHNRIAVSIKKTGEMLQVFIDSHKIAEYPKAVPADLLFTAVSFLVGGNYAEHDKFYVGNIKVSKE